MKSAAHDKQQQAVEAVVALGQLQMALDALEQAHGE
jgi:hypothetical protein